MAMNKKDEMKYVYPDSISGETVRKARKSLGMTQKEFGEAMGISGSGLQSIDLGVRNASDSLLRTIAEKTGF